MQVLKRLAPALVAFAIVGVAWIPWHPLASPADVVQASHGLSFEKLELPAAQTNQHVRQVAPALKHIAPWISAVGASVGAFDLRGLGRDGDGCMTDPRDDQLRIFPIPGSGGKIFPTFTLRPDGLRFDATMAPMGCVPTDINQDGRPDVIAYYWGRSPVIFLNICKPGDQPSRASFKAMELVTPMEVWNTTALNVVDVDGDGRLDILVGNYFPDGARVLDPSATNDDLMQMQHSMGGAHNAGVNRLFLGGSPTAGSVVPSFVDASNRLPAESARSWTLAFGAQDLTGDGKPELYVANDFGPDQLLVNRSTPGHVDLSTVVGARDPLTAKSKVLGNDSFKGMGVAFSYAQGASLPRIFVSNITSPWALQESNLAFYPDGVGTDLLNGSVPFKERSAEVGLAHSGWSWDVKAADLTSSGSDSLIQASGFVQGTRNFWPRLQELAMGNDQILSNPLAWPNFRPGDDLSGHERARLWVQVGGRFVDVGEKVPFSQQDLTRGIAVGDFNGDGRMDFMVAGQWGPSYVYINHSDQVGSAAIIHVVRQVGSDGAVTPLVGATVTVRGANYRRTAQLYPANGHSGVSGSTLQFAFPKGAHDLIARVEWADSGGRHVQEMPVQAGTQQLKVSP